MSFAGSGTVENFGTISGVRSGGEGVHFAGGTITNGGPTSTDAVLQGHFIGAYLTGTGRITNYGKLTGGGVGALFQAGGTLVNGSAADKTALVGNGLDGIDFSGPAAGTVTNFGTIRGGIVGNILRGR